MDGPPPRSGTSGPTRGSAANRPRPPGQPDLLRWDHDAHYHPWVLRHLPPDAGAALDVGCGAGTLTRLLAARLPDVTGVDRDEGMLRLARGRTPPATPVTWIAGDLLDADTALDPRGYDVVTAVGSLHHLPLRAGLARLVSLVRPGGTLLVVGRYRLDPTVASDVAATVVALPANVAVGVARTARARLAGHRNPAADSGYEDRMPTRAPEHTLAEIREVAAELAPGARVRRQLYWRYTLQWRHDLVRVPVWSRESALVTGALSRGRKRRTAPAGVSARS